MKEGGNEEGVTLSSGLASQLLCEPLALGLLVPASGGSLN